jgi:uncharacterized protein (DUF58 family)
LSPLKKYFHHWAEKRSPRAAQVILRHKTIYILPGRQGLGFLWVVILIWLLGTNYQNNLILAFSFFLISVMLVSTIHAFKNMLGVTFVAAQTQYAAVGDIAAFELIVSSQYNGQHHSLLLLLQDSVPVAVNLAAGETTSVSVGLVAQHRGWLKLPRITVKSYFPLGFIRAWAYVELEHKALIYPRPVACEKPPLGAGQGDASHDFSQQRGDEFQGFQTYQAGSPLSQVAWKQYARGAGMHLKDFRAPQSQACWLDWQFINATNTELGLSHMSYWVNQFAEKNVEFGLILPNKVIAMGKGNVHRLQALTALALLGWVEAE